MGADLQTLSDCPVYPLASGSLPNSLLGGIRHPGLDPTFDQWSIKKDKAAIAVENTYLQAQATPTQSLKGESLYGGVLLNHYGHLISECCHRLYGYKMMEETLGRAPDHVLFIPEVNKPKATFKKILTHTLPYAFQPSNIKKTLQEIFTYFSIPKAKLRYITRPIIAETLHIPKQQSFLGMIDPTCPDYLAFLSSLEPQLDQHTAADSANKLYVSRTNFLLKGSIAGETYIEEHFRRAGYAIYYPEQHSLLSQLATYRAAEEIVFMSGSAMHTTELLGSLKAKVTILARRPLCSRVFTRPLLDRSTDATFHQADEFLPSLFLKQDGSLVRGNALSFMKAERLNSILTNLTGQPIDEAAYLSAVKKEYKLYLDHYTSLCQNSPNWHKRCLEPFNTSLRANGLSYDDKNFTI